MHRDVLALAEQGEPAVGVGLEGGHLGGADGEVDGDAVARAQHGAAARGVGAVDHPAVRAPADHDDVAVLVGEGGQLAVQLDRPRLDAQPSPGTARSSRAR